MSRAAQHELDDLLLHLKGLVYVRAVLQDRGASAAELEQHSAEIDRLRTRLAELVKGSVAGYAAAA